MSPLSQAGLLIINTVGSLILLVVLLRFLLQLVRADFYNPISQFIVRFTNPFLIPLRRMIPGLGGIDLASLVLAILIQYLLIILLTAVQYQTMNLPWIFMFGWSLLGLLKLTFSIYFWGILIVAIASWVAPNSYNPVLILINQLLEPIVTPVRRVMPDLGGLDLSPMVVLLGIKILEILLIYPLAQQLQVPRGIIFGL